MSQATTRASSQGANTGQEPPPNKDLRGLMPYLRRYTRSIVLGLFMVVLMGIIGNLLPLAIGILTDTLSGSPAPFQHAAGTTAALSATPRLSVLSRAIPYYEPNSHRTLGIYCLVLVLCVAIKGLLSFEARWKLIGVSRDIEYDIRSDLLKRLLALEPEFYVRNRTGELMSRATNDLNSVRMVLGPGIMYSATTLVTMIMAILVMVTISPSLTLWVLVPAPVVAVAVWYFGKTIHELYEKIQAALATLTARVQENLAGVRIVRAYAQEDAEIRAFDEPNREYVSRNIRLIRTWSMFMPSLTALSGTSFLVLLWQGGHQLLRGEISLGALIAFNGYLAVLVWPMIALGWVTNIFQRGAASMGRLNFILTATPHIDDKGATLPKDATPVGEIEFRDLTFTYPTDRAGANGSNGSGKSNGNGPRPVLSDINLKIPAGSTLAVVGPTGCGKTTLAALVARLWEAPEGTVLIDGHPIQDWPLDALRRSIGYVPQDTYLFSETVGGNIAFGIPNYNPERAREAAEIASLHGDIQDFASGYDTAVGERGITLSGGQKQRTAIARAIVRDPRILILDDALSSVDTQTEEKILSGLRAVMRGRTTILISHRTSTVKNADQIVVLREGRIIERGTHDQLLERGGYYADLYQKQLLEEELENA